MHTYISRKFTVEMTPRRILHEKTQRFLRGRRGARAYISRKFTVEMKARPIYIRFFRGWWRTEEGVYINKEQRLGVGCNDIVQVARITHVWCYGTGGVGVGCNDIVEVAHMFDVTEQVGLGLGWGVMTSLKLHTCLMLRNRWGWGWSGV